MKIKIFFIFFLSNMLSSCFLFEKSTKNFPKLELSYISIGHYLTKDYEKNHRVPYLSISSNIDIETEAINRNLTISGKNLFCVFDKKMLKNSEIPNSYKTISGFASDEDKEKKNNHFIYNFTIWATENTGFKNLPADAPEKLNQKKDTDILHCQYVIYFYMAKPIVKSNIIEIPFKDIREIIEK